jgi:HAD superfamily hydrolase (TIGR01549 family)
MNITAVFFDLDGTLRFNEPLAIPTFHRHAAELGVEAGPDQLREAERWTHAYWASSNELLEDIETFGGWEQNGAFWANHARRHLLELGASEEAAEELAPIITRKMHRTYQPVDYVPEDVLPTLRDLRQAGCRLGLISNRYMPVGEIVARLGLEEFLEFSLAAGEVNLWKPDPRLLLYAASMAGIESEQTAYVGDSYYADVVCARAAGMVPVLVDPEGLFPEADCRVIAAISQLPEALNISI